MADFIYKVKDPLLYSTLVLSAAYAWLGNLPILEANSKYAILGICAVCAVIYYYAGRNIEQTEEEVPQDVVRNLEQSGEHGLQPPVASTKAELKEKLPPNLPEWVKEGKERPKKDTPKPVLPKQTDVFKEFEEAKK